MRRRASITPLQYNIRIEALQQACPTRRPRAACGPGQLVMRPSAHPNLHARRRASEEKEERQARGKVRRALRQAATEKAGAVRVLLVPRQLQPKSPTLPPAAVAAAAATAATTATAAAVGAVVAASAPATTAADAAAAPSLPVLTFQSCHIQPGYLQEERRNLRHKFPVNRRLVHISIEAKIVHIMVPKAAKINQQRMELQLRCISKLKSSSGKT